MLSKSRGVKQCEVAISYPELDGETYHNWFLSGRLSRVDVGEFTATLARVLEVFVLWLSLTEVEPCEMVKISLVSSSDGHTSYLNDAGQSVGVHESTSRTPALPSSTLSRLASLEEACVSPPSAETWWQFARHRSRRLSKLTIGVLGSSTTAGCGALSPSMRCSMPLSWGRHAHDALAAAMRPRGIAMQTNIYQKNAVEASFFFDCMNQLLPKHPDVVILEVLQNRYSMDLFSSLNMTTAAVREVQPTAAITFVVWLKPQVVEEQPAMLKELRGLARALGIDLIDVPSAMASLGFHVRDVYAKTPSGRTDHHPNGMGHELIGALAAQCITRRLERQGFIRDTEEPSEDVPSNEEGSASNRSSGKSHFPELCFSSADELPVRSQSGFVLQDDGKAKGVKKLGYSSTRVGDRLTIGPINLHVESEGRAHSRAGLPAGVPVTELPAGVKGSCYQHVRVRLGYLVSTSQGMGELHVNCRGGCACRPSKSKLLRTVLPFPRLDGDARRLPEWGLDSRETVTMTAHTLFIASLFNFSNHTSATVLAGESACYLELLHRTSHDRSSRVRVDSLALLVHGDSPVVPC